MQYVIGNSMFFSDVCYSDKLKVSTLYIA